MGTLRLGRAGVAALFIAVALNGCASSAKSGTSSGVSSGTPTLAASTTPSGSTSGTPADAATTAAIARAYAAFFASTSTITQSQAALQHGDRFVATLRKQGSSSYADRSSAALNSARLVSPDVADVIFTIRSGGSVLLSQAPGLAVRTGGHWQVAAKTFCGLLTLEGDAPAACSDPAVTALPD